MGLSPERKLLLACAKAKLTAEDRRLILQYASRADIDWDYIKTASFAHGMAPLIYRSLRQSGMTRLLPQSAAEALRSTYYGNAARNSLLYDELHGVLKAFSDERIETIVLKGAVLAESVYPHRALRPMSDIDLLVRKEQLANVENKLVDMGYVLEKRVKTKEYYLELHYHWVFAKPSAISIEIHWHITRPNSPFRIDINGLWDRAQPIASAGVEALSLSVEDLLLHLCQHMHKHNLIGGIRPLCDIARVIEHYHNAIDWMALKARSFQWGISPYVYLALYLAKELLDARVPSSFLDGIEPAGFDRAVIDWTKERLLDCESSQISSNVVLLCCNDRRFKDRLAALASALAPHVIAESYGVPQNSYRIPLVYFPRRIRYLLTRYGPLIWQRVRGDQKTRLELEKEDNQLRLTKWLSSAHH